MKKTIFMVIAIICVMSLNCFAQETVPLNIQTVLFKKIFGFDKTLVSKGKIEVAVLGSGGDAVASAFKEIGISAKASSGDQIPDGTTVVYFTSGSIKSHTASKGILSISGSSSLVESGKVAIGLGIEGGKPKIIIHMGQLKAEGQELSAELLKISKVIQ